MKIDFRSKWTLRIQYKDATKRWLPKLSKDIIIGPSDDCVWASGLKEGEKFLHQDYVACLEALLQERIRYLDLTDTQPNPDDLEYEKTLFVELLVESASRCRALATAKLEVKKKSQLDWIPHSHRSPRHGCRARSLSVPYL